MNLGNSHFPGSQYNKRLEKDPKSTLNDQWLFYSSIMNRLTNQENNPTHHNFNKIRSKIKYLGFKEIKDLYNGNFRTLKKEFKQILEDG